MKNIKTILGLALFAAFILMTITGCGGNGGKTVDGKTNLDWWHFWTDPVIKPVIEQMVADFETQNPDIKVNLTDLTWANGHEKIVIAFSSGNAPDIVELGSDWIAEFSFSDQLADISAKVAPDSAQFYGWTPTICDDKIYAQPWILGTRVLYINKDLMVRAGFYKDYIPYNMEMMSEVCYKIDSLGKDIHGFGSNSAEKHRLYKKWLPFFYSLGGRIMSLDGKHCVISSDKAYKSLKYYKELSDNVSMVDTQRRLEDAFLDGKIGVIISGDWLYKRIKNEKRDIDYFTAVIPGPEYPGKSFAGGEYLAISKNSPNKEAAFKFIKYITSPENQLKFCMANFSANPSSKAITEDSFFVSDENLHTFIRQMNLSTIPEPMPQWVYVEDLIERMLEDVLFNGAPIAESLYETKLKIEDLVLKKENE